MNPKSEVCKECAAWQQHQHKCWFYWEGKKECTQFKEDMLSEPKHKNMRFDPESLLE